jgi:hypothetical protein
LLDHLFLFSESVKQIQITLKFEQLWQAVCADTVFQKKNEVIDKKLLTYQSSIVGVTYARGNELE